MLPDGTAWSLDTLVEGVHFDARLRAEDVGWKAVAVSVSDVAAMGAVPRDLLVGLSVPADGDMAFVEGFARGLGEAVRHFGLTLVGGDTTRSGRARTVTTVVGGPCVAEPLMRSGASEGDDLWVTGLLGLAGEGWATANPSDAALHALRRPTPPVAFALDLAREHLASAAMDLSDGLAVDLPRLCRASGVGAVIEPDRVPGVASLQLRVCGGDDFELLFTAPAACRDAIEALATRHGVRATRVGAVTAGPAVVLAGTAWPAPLFAHFGGAS